MDSREFFEQAATSIAALNRDELKRHIRNFRGRFQLDFSEEYLDQLNVDRLRHILLAAHIMQMAKDKTGVYVNLSFCHPYAIPGLPRRGWKSK